MDPEIIRAYQLSPIMANHYNAHTAYEQKVEALVSRSTTQARDIFDLNLLLNSGVDSRLENATLKSRLGEAQSNMMAINFVAFKSQVLSFLHPDYQLQYDSPVIWDDMILKIGEALSKETI